jgi:hypothetical protein
MKIRLTDHARFEASRRSIPEEEIASEHTPEPQGIVYELKKTAV